MNKVLFATLVATLFAAVASPARAQVAPYAMLSVSHYSGLGVGTGTSPSQSGGITPIGGTAGVYTDSFHAGPIALGMDVRGMLQNSSNSTPYGKKLVGLLAGGRIGANAVVLPFRPYAQVEIGAVGTNGGNSYNKTYGFAYQVQVGGDFTLLPHVGFRLEYGAGQVTSRGNSNHTLQTLGAGLVLRL